MSRIRTYSELSRLETFEERFEYLRLGGSVGRSTFGFDRWINQRFYGLPEWKSVRDFVIVRDNGCDLGIPGFEIHSMLMVHHMNPVTVDDIVNGEEWILDPNFLISTSRQTHNAIHYSNESLIPTGLVARVKGDTRLW